MLGSRQKDRTENECSGERMLRWTSGVSREDKIRNEYIRGSIGVASIVDKMREIRL